MKKRMISLSLLLTAMPSFTQDIDSLKSIFIDEVTIVGEQKKLTTQSSHFLTTLDKTDIQHSPVTNIQDVLSYIPGIDIRKRGVDGVQADLSIRGGTFDQVLILLNGINITDPQTGHYSMDLPVDLSSVDRIELLQGSGSRLLGPNAFSGAVNIHTGKAEKNELKAQLSAGQFGYINGNIHGTLKHKDFTGFASFSGGHSEGYIKNTDYDLMNAFIHGTYDNPKTGKISVQAGFQNKNYGANSFYSLAYPNQFEHTRTFFTAATYEKQIQNFYIAPQVYWRQHHDRFELFRHDTETPDWYSGHNYHQTDVIGANINTHYRYKIGKTALSVDFRNEHIYSNVLGEDMQKKPVPFEKDTYFLKAKNRTNWNFILDQTFYFWKFAASVGLIGNYTNDFGFRVYFGGDLAYNVADNWNIYASVNQTFRLPTFTDLYYESANLTSNRNLKPEEAITCELGVKFSRRPWYAQVSSYYRQGKNIIDWIKLPEDEKWQSTNWTNVNGAGFEIIGSYAPNKILQKIELGYAFSYSDKKSGTYISKYALDYLKHKATLNIDHKIAWGFGASWRLTFQQRAGTYIDMEGNVNNYKPFVLADVQLYWTRKNITVFADMNNILNFKYYDIGGILQPGFWIKGGIKVILL